MSQIAISTQISSGQAPAPLQTSFGIQMKGLHGAKLSEPSSLLTAAFEETLLHSWGETKTANRLHLMFKHTLSVTVFSFFHNQILDEFTLKGTVHPKILKIHIFPLTKLFISLDSFGVSCLVFEISAVQISAFSLI